MLKQSLGAEGGEILPIVIGTRGALPKMTKVALSKVGIQSRRDLLTISLTALRASLEIYHNFMDYDAPPRDRDPRTPTGPEPPNPS